MIYLASSVCENLLALSFSCPCDDYSTASCNCVSGEVAQAAVLRIGERDEVAQENSPFRYLPPSTS